MGALILFGGADGLGEGRGGGGTKALRHKGTEGLGEGFLPGGWVGRMMGHYGGTGSMVAG